MTVGVNDYPWPNAPCGANNSNNCGYAYRNCTDFVQWRMRQLGLGCHLWGNAATWDSRARAQGFAVDHNPQVGDVAQFPPWLPGISSDGHVAYVLQVGSGRVFVEQYNDGIPCGYNQTWWPSAGVNFIHIGGTGGGPPPQPRPGPCDPPCAPPLVCIGGLCRTPPSTMGAFAPVVIIAATVTGLAWYEARRRGESLTRYVEDVAHRVERGRSTPGQGFY